MINYIPHELPIKGIIEIQKNLKKAISTNSVLAKLNGIVKIISNQAIMINSLVLQEAKDSSEIKKEKYRCSITNLHTP